MELKDQIVVAARRIHEYVRYTPLIFSDQLSMLCQANVYLKLENLQPTASFKVRGAFNKLLSLSKAQQAAGVVAASTGNHGAAVAYACKQLNIKAEIFVPVDTSPHKIAAINSYGAVVNKVGAQCSAAEDHARNYAQQHSKSYVSPYNDLDIIAGQATSGYEILQQLPTVNAIFVCIGGGGLIAGVGAFIKQNHKPINIVGCLPENSPVMSESIKAGKLIDLDIKPTLSDSSAGNIEANAITFDLCKQYVDDYILASENEIASALRLMLEKEHMLVEGAAAVTLACLYKQRQRYRDQNIVLLLCGSNISMTNLRSVLE